MTRYSGVVMGTVKSAPDELGRVQVQLPWLSESMGDYPWAAVATPLTGGDRGMYFMPELGDEVAVAFEQGSFEHPIIVGFLWNGAQQPPETDPKNRVIVTPGGHTLRFEDGDNSKKIIIRSNGRHEIILDDTPAGQTVTLKTNGNQTIVLDDKGPSIRLQGGGRTLTLISGTVQIT